MNAWFHNPHANCVLVLRSLGFRIRDMLACCWKVTVLFAFKDKIESGTGAFVLGRLSWFLIYEHSRSDASVNQTDRFWSPVSLRRSKYRGALALTQRGSRLQLQSDG